MANGTVAASQIEMLSQSGTGITTIVPPATNTDRTLTLPDNTGTVITTASTFAGTGPAFSAYQSTQQTGIAHATFTLVNFQTEEFDTASRFNNTGSAVGGIPAYAFMPNIAGYYQVNLAVWMETASNTLVATFCNLWKNGGWFKDGSFQNNINNNATDELGTMLSTLVYLNGTTDYVQGYVWNNITSGTASCYDPYSQQRVTFSASLVRSA